MGSPDIDPGLRRGFDIGMSSGTDNSTEGVSLVATPIEASDSQLDIDPLTIDTEQYQQFDPVFKKNVDLDLLRKGDEGSIAKLSELEPGFEMSYPLSDIEKIAFGDFEKYVNGTMFPNSSLMDTWDSDVIRALDEEKERRSRGDPNLRRHRIDGFKVKRWERWELEEQIRQERKAMEDRQELPQAA